MTSNQVNALKGMIDAIVKVAAKRADENGAWLNAYINFMEDVPEQSMDEVATVLPEIFAYAVKAVREEIVEQTKHLD